MSPGAAGAPGSRCRQPLHEPLRAARRRLPPAGGGRGAARGPRPSCACSPGRRARGGDGTGCRGPHGRPAPAAPGPTCRRAGPAAPGSAPQPPAPGERSWGGAALPSPSPPSLPPAPAPGCGSGRAVPGRAGAFRAAPAARGGQQQAAVPDGAVLGPEPGTYLRHPAVLVDVQVRPGAQEQLSPPALAVAHHCGTEGP